jgi:uncharacterized repeat protein (TIGR03803 family)
VKRFATPENYALTTALLLRVSFMTVLLLTVASSAPAQSLSNLYTFVGADNSVNPDGVIAQGRDGAYYGVAVGPQPGTIYKVTGSGGFTLLHSMAQAEGQGCNGLILGTDGNLYGTCPHGGDSQSAGTIIKMTPAGALTVLHTFNYGLVDGCYPDGVPVQASDGNFYGTTLNCGANNEGTAYKITPAGVETIIHSFAGGTDAGQPIGALILGSDGNLWGESAAGGSYNSGTVFKMSLSGAVTVVYQFLGCGAQGCYPAAGLVQGNDGNYYGTTQEGGTSNEGVVFKLTPAGAITILHSFNRTVDIGAYPQLPLTLGTDGNFYGVASDCISGGCSPANIFRITPAGVFTDVYNFTNYGGNNNSLPFSPLLLGTNGTLYSTTEEDGKGAGTFFSLVDGQNPFIQLQQASGNVGSQVGILGQGFSSSSVVKFNGVAATTITVTGTTFITATVPAGATDGSVTVTTGSTTLTSRTKFTVHNSWSAGTALPTAVAGAASGFAGGKVYVVGGFSAQGGAPVSNNQAYNPTTNAWTTAAAIPTPVYGAASAVLNGLLYVIGGYEGAAHTATNLVQIYNPTKNTWTTGSAMLTARGSVTAVVDGTAIYVFGGNGATQRLKNAEKYVPSTNTWTEEAAMTTGKSEAAAGLLGSTIVVADGYTTSGNTGNNEGYTVSANTWSSLTADATPRNAACYGVLSGQIYVAGGLNNASPQVTSKVNESFNASTKKWTGQLALPTASAWPASTVANGRLFCIGGQATFQGAVIKNVQIYQP